MNKLITAIFLLIVANSFSQDDSRHDLEEIVLIGTFAPSFHVGYKIEVINDSILKTNHLSLGDLLQNQANFYLKQNGNGMVSSIALRGTNASQTGVYWNGIAINSSLNGQTDFNTLRANNFDEVTIRKGGASVLLGSGAIGGAINLSDKIVFQNKKEAGLSIEAGSYESFASRVNALVSNENLFAKFSFGGTSSANDYPYLNSDLKNENGQYKNYHIDGVFAYKINERHNLNYYTSFVDNERNNSRTLTSPSHSKLLNFDTRNMLDWKYLGNNLTSSFKMAYLTEDFTYFFDKDQSNSSKGKSQRLLSKYDLTYFLNNSILLKGGLSFKNEEGWGSNIPRMDQNIFNTYLLFHQQPMAHLSYNLSIRKGYSSVFDIPFIYALDAKYDLSDQIDLQAAFSTNYRTPTFNDLYWEPGGNGALKSEMSRSAELGFNYQLPDFRFGFTSYYIKSDDLIQWRPVTGNIWQPQNIQEVFNYGVEVSAVVQKKFNQHAFQVKLQYDYTVSEDASTNKQLIYVPFHKANSIFNYQYKKWNFTYNLQYTGKVYTTTSNSQSIDAYSLSHIDMKRTIFNNKIFLAFKINNLLDENYQSVAYRPMPNRNYSIQIQLKI